MAEKTQDGDQVVRLKFIGARDGSYIPGLGANEDKEMSLSESAPYLASGWWTIDVDHQDRSEAGDPPVPPEPKGKAAKAEAASQETEK